MGISKKNYFYILILVISCVIYFGVSWHNKSFPGHFRQNVNLDEIRMRTGSEGLTDLMTEGPFDFLPNYRNPCWIADNATTPIKCLPYFYLVGAPKCGTTDLFSRIRNHPSVSSNTRKEPHWISRKYYRIAGLTLDDYLRYFRKATNEIFQTKNGDNFHPIVIGDASASTLWDNNYWKKLPQYRNLSEPLYTNADYIHHLNPHTKIIVILRNPVDRLYSSYLYFRKKARTPQHFHKDVVDALDYFNDCLLKHTLRYCVYCNRPTEKEDRLKEYLVIGIFYVHMKEYFRVFPKQQIHVVKMEDYSKNIISTLKDMFHFLDLEPLPDEKLRQISMAGKKNTRTRTRHHVGEMLPKTRRLLEDFYRPYNRELVKILGEKFDYNK